MTTRVVSELCKHCGRVAGLHPIPDYACPDGEHLFTPRMLEGYDTRENLMKLVHHCWLYSGYPNNGYEKMSLDDKALWHHCIESQHEED